MHSCYVLEVLCVLMLPCWLFPILSGLGAGNVHRMLFGRVGHQAVVSPDMIVATQLREYVCSYSV